MQQGPSFLLKQDGTMGAARTKAIPVIVLREETGVSADPNLPQQNQKAVVVVVDAI